MKINYDFKNGDLLKEALTHPSYKSSTKSPSYERLEFLGDKILNAVIARYIYLKYTEFAEGQLSLIHSNLVSSDAINRVAVKISLGDMMIMDKGEECSGGRKNPNNIENTMEALIGAVFLDGGYDHAESFVLNLWDGSFSEDELIYKNPKSLLQEIVQKDGRPIPTYKLIQKIGPAHDAMFNVSVSVEGVGNESANGHSIKEAECNAALKLIEKIKAK